MNNLKELLELCLALYGGELVLIKLRDILKVKRPDFDMLGFLYEMRSSDDRMTEAEDGHVVSIPPS